ncbi:MAG: thioredoxin-dependent thiol peroxidase [Myxococcota bacterium]|nr:thioredoxin-dependent thiol peroxidase [Myxococcota bacterium]
MAMPTVGDPAPALAGPTDEGAFDLSLHAGRPVVVYFYPKDLTPGCTTEACGFRDARAELESAGAVVVGVSKDPPKRHAKFREKHGLNFPLVSDEDGSICEAWGVWQLKKFMGREYMGIVRATFLIGPDGTVAQAWPKVRVKGHVDAVLEAIGALS